MSSSLSQTKKSLVFAMALLLSSPTIADDYRHWTAENLLKAWSAASIDCTGVASSDPETENACARRDEIDKALLARGYCFVGGGSTARWEKGPAAKWKRGKEEAVCTWSDMFFGELQ